MNENTVTLPPNERLRAFIHARCFDAVALGDNRIIRREGRPPIIVHPICSNQDLLLITALYGSPATA